MDIKYTDLIWDWDGTLYNSYPQMLRGFSELLHSYGFNFGEDRLLLEMKREVKGFLKEICPLKGLDFERLYVEYQGYTSKYETEESLKPFDGMMPMLERLKKLGCQHYVFTHRDYRAREICSNQGYEHIFSGWLMRDDEGFARKPSGDGIRYIIKKYSLKFENCLMIGDRAIDISSAKNAGIRGMLFEPDLLGVLSSESPKTAAELERAIIDCV